MFASSLRGARVTNLILQILVNYDGLMFSNTLQVTNNWLSDLKFVLLLLVSHDEGTEELKQKDTGVD